MIKILMAEDDLLLVNVYEKMFKVGGFNIEFVKDGEEALSRLKNMGEKPDIVLLDIIMPKMSGFEVKEEMNKDPELKNIPVVFLTNLYEEADEKKGMSLGAVAYLIKSQYIPSEIVNQVKDLCKKLNKK